MMEIILNMNLMLLVEDNLNILQIYSFLKSQQMSTQSKALMNKNKNFNLFSSGKRMNTIKYIEHLLNFQKKIFYIHLQKVKIKRFQVDFLFNKIKAIKMEKRAKVKQLIQQLLENMINLINIQECCMITIRQQKELLSSLKTIKNHIAYTHLITEQENI
ncbi:hypothetical protein TTHERM_000564149 (macronuclear) [Tetrahymena thermophila SB210]|uniref:Uncharacterized protein n=1 Tax=Tetrahymena thermophila (strain SB210) TaxID=312017 RepID=W7X0Y6_TETTS|nr:hypothetical protein TTHERM_000564149 [Tetrahymena thermophila SB210]EWS72810.1 hypothetical protein TTHERM_000564149 [Tetrahymena thermophila SB210]|eukprot:XP_012654636.1 hypothetical protein TTHERM_000564149 [Tetrahymena thermophila SB210]